jgi:hypothetical protein
MRLLHYVPKDRPLQDIEGWQGLIFGFAENQPLPTLLNPLRQSHCEQSEAIFFQNNSFSGQ